MLIIEPTPKYYLKDYPVNIFNIYDLCRLQILIFVYKSCNNILPSKYLNNFACTKEIHSYSTRSTEHGNLYVINA